MPLQLSWPHTRLLFIILLCALFALALYFSSPYYYEYVASKLSNPILTSYSFAPSETLLYTFNTAGMLEETRLIYESPSPYWWLNSGGLLLMREGMGATQHGPLEEGSQWQQIYSNTNPLDTENGYFPQNIFRLLTRGVAENKRQEIRFSIDAVHLTSTPNRGGWSGIFLINRYRDDDNLYYAGIRMDGYAVIKKKYDGVYYTMAYAKLFSPEVSYNKDAISNLLPDNRWMRIRSDITTQQNGSVIISLWLDETDNGAYTRILEATDAPGAHQETDALYGAGHGGIRTDYMDISFDEYRITVLP